MKAVGLIFPDTTSIANFLLWYKPSKLEVNSTQRTLSGRLAEELIVIALTQYGAELKPVHSFFSTD
jgi:hypothetical protein